jgi:hypothetical protein
VGRNNTDVFTIDRPARDIWPFIKDFNLWEGSHFVYSGVIGDLEGQTFFLSAREAPPDPSKGYFEQALSAKRDPTQPLRRSPYIYQVLKVVPEHLIVFHQPVPIDGGNGGISPGFHLIVLDEHEGRTTVTFYTSHMTRATGKSEEEMLAPFRATTNDLISKFKDNFIPSLKKLVYEQDTK